MPFFVLFLSKIVIVYYIDAMSFKSVSLGMLRDSYWPRVVYSHTSTGPIKKIIHSSGVHISIADGRPTVLSTGRMIKKLTGSPKDHFPALIPVIRQISSSPPLRKYELRFLL